MPPRSRYAVDPSLSQPQQQQQQQQGYGGQAPSYPSTTPGGGSGGAAPAPEGQYFSPGLGGPAAQQYYHHQQQQQQVPLGSQGQYFDQNRGPQLHNVSDRRTPPPTGEYAPQPAPAAHTQTYHAIQPQTHQPQQAYAGHPNQSSLYPPQGHIPQPPHSAGPSITGPRMRIDPAQVPNPVDAQELDQNLFDDEEFMSCNTHGVIPLAGTDYRGIDQGNSLPRYLRPTLPVIPTNGQLLDTTALPFALLVHPFAQLRYDEAPVPLVSNWVSGESAFATPSATLSGGSDVDASGGVEEDAGPPRCEKCRGYINPWVRWVDGGRKWMCNLCGNNNNAYFSHLAPTGQRLDHSDRPELMYGTVDFPVPRAYWAPQPSGSSLLDRVANESSLGVDALASTAGDLLSGLQSSLGQAPTPRGPSPAPGYKERERERKREEKRLRRPQPLSRVFVIDASAGSVARGVVREVCEGIRKALYGEKKEKRSEDGGDAEEDEADEGVGRGEKVAFMTVAETVGFWNLSSSMSGPSLSVVSDLDDMFVPYISGFLVDPLDSRSQIENLLDMLPEMMEQQPDGNRVAAGAGITGALSALRLFGGQISLFLSQLPTLGPGKLTVREDPSVYNTDKEKSLFTAADPFWRTTADELAEAGVGVNVFLFPDQYTDIASVGTLSAVTGGEAFFHPKFSPVRDRDILQDEIRRTIVRETVYNATIRIRCSNGLRVSDHLGNFYQRSLTDLEFGTLDDAKSFAAVLKHEGARLDEKTPAYVQVAVLYTSSDGHRRVRCLNMSFTATSLIGNVFRFADLDAAVTVFTKEAVTQMTSKSLKDVRKNLQDRCNRPLLMYRKHCAPAVQAGQLILPEGFKLLPLFTLCMLKTKPIKGGNVTSDVRVHYMRLLRSASTTVTLNMLYPRMLAIHDLTDQIGFPGANGRLKLPRFMRASYEFMVAHGAYLLVNGEVAMLWFGSAVSPQILDDLYGAENLDELDIRMTRLPKLPTLLSTQLRNILTHLERILGKTLPVVLVRQNMDGMEIEFANHLVEDSNNDALGYTDYLMTAHKAITNELTGSGGKGDSWRPW